MDVPDLAWLAGALVVAALALVVNPNGLAIYGYPFETAGILAHRDFIFEWSRPDLTSLPGQLLFGFLALVVVPTLLVAARTMRAADALSVVGAAILSLTAVRFVAVIGPVGALLACVYLAPWLAATLSRTPFARAFERMGRARTGRLAVVNLVLSIAVAVLGVGIAVARVTPASEQEAIADAMPAGATAWLAQHRADARVFNVYAWGGWLGRELPASKVFIDGRSDIYGDARIRRFADVIALRSDPSVLFDQYRVDTVVFWPDSTLAGWLDARREWQRTYSDRVAAIWVRRPD
jgi:hypothetical protein